WLACTGTHSPLDLKFEEIGCSFILVGSIYPSRKNALSQGRCCCTPLWMDESDIFDLLACTESLTDLRSHSMSPVLVDGLLWNLGTPGVSNLAPNLEYLGILQGCLLAGEKIVSDDAIFKMIMSRQPSRQPTIFYADPELDTRIFEGLGTIMSDSHESRYYHLLTTNREPSDLEIPELRGIIADREMRIARVDTQIMEVQRTLYALKKYRKLEHDQLSLFRPNPPPASRYSHGNISLHSELGALYFQDERP
ncbi:hypothetical protein Hypma_004893, partial [Hypsizygus marmoreus]